MSVGTAGTTTPNPLGASPVDVVGSSGPVPTSVDQGLLRSPLHDRHVALGAALVPFAGWLMPLRYGSETAEHRAVRSTAGLFDLSHMGELEVTGPDAARLLDACAVSELSRLRVGGAKYTMVATPEGGVLDDLVVYRLADQHFLVVANAANTPAVVAVLSGVVAGEAAGLDAQVRDRTRELALLAVQGPASVAALQPLTDLPLSELSYYAGSTGTVFGVECLVARTGYTGEDGFEVYLAADAAPAVWDALAEQVAAVGGQPAGLSARDSLRLEAGMPLYGQELTAATTPWQAGLGRVVHLDRAAFLGSAALTARRDEPARRLVGLTTNVRRAPRPGCRVLARPAEGSDALTGQEVGVVTSGSPSPTLGHPVAMAYVEPHLAEPGTEVDVEVRGTAVRCVVVALPFYRRQNAAHTGTQTPSGSPA